jgi:uroporphyrinogen-III synthase
LRSRGVGAVHFVQNLPAATFQQRTPQAFAQRLRVTAAAHIAQNSRTIGPRHHSRQLHNTIPHFRKGPDGHLTAAAIGPATAKAIEQHGLPVDVVPEKYVAESVVEALEGEVKGKRVLLVRAKVARDVIPRELTALGAKVDVAEAYETVLPGTSAAALRVVLRDPDQKPHAVTFTSSSTVHNFLDLLGEENRGLLDGVKLASIGPVTSETLRQAGLEPHIEAKEYTVPALAEALANNL